MDSTILGSIISGVLGLVGAIIAAIITARLQPSAPSRPPRPIPRRYDGQPSTRPSPPPDLPQTGSGLTVTLSALAAFLFFTGFGMFMYVVVMFITTIFSALQTNGEPDLSAIPFVPLVPLGIGLAFAGMLVAMVRGLVESARMSSRRRHA